MSLRRIAVLTIFLTPLLSTARAQPLADKVPADALLYVGWQGAGSPAPGFEGSHLQAILKGSDVSQFIDEFLPRVAQFAAQKDPDLAQVMPMVTAVVRPLWNYPSALYVGPLNVNPGGGGPPMPRVAMFINAGGDSDRVLADLNGPLTQAQNAGVPVAAKAGGGLVVVALGPNLADELVAHGNGNGNGNAPALAADAAFKAAMAQVPHDPVCAAYVNVRQIVTMVDGFILAAPPEALATWTKARDAIGLRGLQSIAVGEAFDGKDWAGGLFVAAPAPRTGFLKAAEAKPLDDAFLKLVPRTSLTMTAVRFRPTAILDGARAVWPMLGDGAPPLEAVLQHVNNVTGVDIEKDFLNAFGDEWAVYTDPATGGTGLVGTALVSRVADPAKLQQSLDKLEQQANKILAENMPVQGITYSLKTKQVGGLTLHYLPWALITPCWAIKDGNLYAGMYPQTVIAAANFGAAHGPSILDNEQFQAIRKRLAAGGTQATGIQFTDLQQVMPLTYGPWVALSRGIGFTDAFGIDSPLMLVPPMKVVMENLGPAGQASWVDDAGFHVRAVSPFPGSVLLGTDLTSASAAEVPLLISVLLPSLSKSREVANRAKDAANLRMIGQGCLIHATEYKGEMPDDLGALVKAEDINVGVFVSPLSETEIPPDVATGTRDVQAAWVKDHSDYVYRGAGRKASDLGGNDVVAHDRPEIARKHGGMNAVYGDGHVEWLSLPQAQRLLGFPAKRGE